VCNPGHTVPAQQRRDRLPADVRPSVAYLSCCILPATVAHFSRLMAATCSQAVTTVHRHVRIGDRPLALHEDAAPPTTISGALPAVVRWAAAAWAQCLEETRCTAVPLVETGAR
jgi:hypothetical protein